MYRGPVSVCDNVKYGCDVKADVQFELKRVWNNQLIASDVAGKRMVAGTRRGKVAAIDKSSPLGVTPPMSSPGRILRFGVRT